MESSIEEKLAWFKHAQYGLFIHWGPYAIYGRGEQVLVREHMDQRDYAKDACAWNPENYDPGEWARTAKQCGFRYAVLTTKHHDGYCLWDTRQTDYSSARQASGRDFVREYAQAFRAEGIGVGFYFSFADMRVPAYFEGPQINPKGWAQMRQFIHDQLEELLTDYGEIDILWFDGVWPRSAAELGVAELVSRMRAWQPNMLINNRLDSRNVLETTGHADGGEAAGSSLDLGDFGTPEHEITPQIRAWESCQTSTWRLWGYAIGAPMRPAEEWLDMLCKCAVQGGNLLLNVGPKADGSLPEEFVREGLKLGRWLELNREALEDLDSSELTEFVTYGYQTIKGHALYLTCRFWHPGGNMRIADIVSQAQSAILIEDGRMLDFEQEGDVLTISGLPTEKPSPLFTVIKIEFNEPPRSTAWSEHRLWCGNPQRIADWARAQHGDSVLTNPALELNLANVP